jgi:hypothetical protein
MDDAFHGYVRLVVISSAYVLTGELSAQLHLGMWEYAIPRIHGEHRLATEWVHLGPSCAHTVNMYTLVHHLGALRGQPRSLRMAVL